MESLTSNEIITVSKYFPTKYSRGVNLLWSNIRDGTNQNNVQPERRLGK